MINPLRGMRDTMGESSEKYSYFIENCTRIAKNYGFSLIETPILEETALFKRSVGESSDIVGKEMYRFCDKGGNDVCMRPEGTAGVVRAFISQKLDRIAGVQRFFYHGPMYRYERPQKGRLRQFHQFGVETFGESSVFEDAMIILMLREMLDFFQISYKLEINSLGDATCMPAYRDKLVHFLNETDGLCQDCERRKITNPIRVLDCKNEHCKELLRSAPLLLDNLSEESKNDFAQLRSVLDAFEVKYEINPKLVRGLDYYNKTAFEFISDAIGAQNAIAGGGRYDRLVEFLDGRPTCGVGFAMGIERLMDLIVMPQMQREGYYIAAVCEEALELLLRVVVQKRRETIVRTTYTIKSFNAHFKAADKLGARYFICIGEDELKNGTLRVKDMQNKDEKSITINEFLG